LPDGTRFEMVEVTSNRVEGADGMSDRSDEVTPAGSIAAQGAGGAGWFSWAKLLRWSAIGGFVAIAAITLFGGVVIPPLVVFALLWLIGAFLVVRRPKAAAILLLITFVLFLALSAPFILPTLTVPASAGDFILNIASVVPAILGIVAAIAVLRRRGVAPSRTPRTLALAGLAVIVLAAVVGVVAMATYEGATAEEGDITLVTEGIEFDQESLQADGGTVAVHVDNKDQTLHTFTIDELDVNLTIPAGSTARVEFDAEPGSYSFYCVPHEADMEGTLEVQ
jgi:plastocyanin